MKSAVRHNQYCHREGRHEIWLSDAISTATARADMKSGCQTQISTSTARADMKSGCQTQSVLPSRGQTRNPLSDTISTVTARADMKFAVRRNQ